MLFVAIGVLGGVLIYLGARLPPAVLFGLAGGAAGLASGLAFAGRRRAVRLTEVTVSVPPLSKMRFAVTQESRLVAWKLFVELTTRVSTQPLRDGHGRLRSALTSLHGLLGFIREVLKENPPSRRTGHEPTVEQLALLLVINDLRPFVTYWHRTFTDWQDLHRDAGETDWPLHDQCHVELSRLQQHLKEYVLSFGELAGVPNAPDVLAGTLAGRAPAQRTAPTGADR